MNKADTPIRQLFKNKKIAVIGDIVADQFLSGTITRVSREAPVFILKHNETETRPGAAANAAANVAALGGFPILVGTIGEDLPGRELRAALKVHGVITETIVTVPAAKTTVKLRVLAGQTYATRQQVIRIDYENEAAISQNTERQLLQFAIQAVAESDAVIVSDYSYGIASKNLIEKVLETAKERGIPAIADSRFAMTNFSGFTAATPNQEEAEALLKGPFEPSTAETLRSQLQLDTVLVTRGGQGVVLAERGRIISIPAIGSEQPVDVTGAGDTVIAAFALGLAAGMSAFDAAAISNHAGGIVVMKRGTAVATAEEVERSLASITDSGASAAANES